MNSPCNKFWDSFAQVPVWTRKDGHLVCTDAKSGTVLAKTPEVLDPKGNRILFFKPYEAVLVKDVVVADELLPLYINTDKDIVNTCMEDDDYPCSVLGAGTKVLVCMKPNGQWLLARRRDLVSCGQDIELGNFSLT